MSAPADDAMTAEFDVMAGWTEDAVRALGDDYAVPAGCQGTGSPSSLSWLAEALEVTPGRRVLDIGSGTGGPAAWLAERFGAVPVCAEPMPAAAAAGRRVHGLTSVVAWADALPFATASFDVAWCLGVLCTVDDKHALMVEARRVLRPAGRLGLLVFVSVDEPTLPWPDGNSFPTEAALHRLCDETGFAVVQRVSAGSLGESPVAWQARADRVDAWIEARHGQDPRWLQAQEQGRRIGALLGSGELRAVLLHLVATS